MMSFLPPSHLPSLPPSLDSRNVGEMVSCKRGREGKEGGREGGVGEGKDECEEGEKEDLA